MNRLTIQRENGNIPRTAAGEDHVSGLLAYVPRADIPEAFADGRAQAVSTIDRAESLGIASTDGSPLSVRILHYQLAELFRVNPSVSLYLMLAPLPEEGAVETRGFDELKRLQRQADGRIRQAAVWDGMGQAPDAKTLQALQAAADALDAENAPLSIVLQPRVESAADVPTTLKKNGLQRISVSLAADGEGTCAALQAEASALERKASVGAVGILLGLLSRAKVHQSISWVGTFPSGVDVPALCDGTLVRDIDRALLEQIDAAHYLMLTTHVGIADSYVADSWTMDSDESDYAHIEDVRTMDKAVRGIRTKVTPELGGNVYVDPDSGKLREYSVSHLETVASAALEDMEKAGELSGYKAEVDPAQDVLGSGQVEIVIKQVPVGVMRRINVRIGYAASV